MGDNKANSTNDAKAAGNSTAAPAVQQYQFALKPPELSGWEAFSTFMWNKETSEFMGRTGCSWLKIGVYYVIYYILLTGYFLAMLFIFYQTLDEKEPKWLGENGIIGGNPGVGFRPMPEKVESTLIWYRHGTYNGNFEEWVTRLEESMKPYQKLKETSKPTPKLIDCSVKDGPSAAGEDQMCKVEVDALLAGACTKENHFGFKDGKPCILLKLNKIFGWKPQPYENATSLASAGAPSDLVDYAKDEDNKEELGKMVWMTCEGENPADKENIGRIEYLPRPGIPTYHFPFENQENYVSPAVFAHFTNPKKGVLISISCKGWAHNIEHNTMERRGSVHFELMID